MINPLSIARAGLALRHAPAAAAPAAFGRFAARGFAKVPDGTEPGTEGSTGRYAPAEKPADEAPEGAYVPPDNPSVDSIRHMMGKANQAAGGDYDFPKTGGNTIRDMASEIASNATAPLERAADGAGGGVMGAVDAARGAAHKVSEVASKAAGIAKEAAGKAASSAKEAAHDAGARAAGAASRATEGGGAGTHTLGEHVRGEDGGGGR